MCIANTIERQVAMWIAVDVRFVGVSGVQEVFLKELIAVAGYSKLHLSLVVKDEVPLGEADGLKRNCSTDNVAMRVEERSWVWKKKATKKYRA